MTQATILLVEDDASLREALADTLSLKGYHYLQAPHAEAALQLLEEQMVDMVVSDISMPGMDGYELQQRLRVSHPYLPVLLMTAYGDISRAVEAMRNGAVDYLLKPFEPQALLQILERHLGQRISSDDQQEPVAEDPASRQLLQLARRVAATDSTVLLCGESGSGKEVLARYIHLHSARKDKPFVALNCAAIPDNMLEATLFGHEKGAFTGAYASVPGKFEQANGGTLLLDEISEMALELQAKLLRVLQEREVERIGGRKTIALDVRVLATTNRKLDEYVAAGKFREDLYYRLNVFPLELLPLRQRPQDIPALAERLLSIHSRKQGRSGVSLSPGARQALLNHSWPGNVRELDNCIQRALILQPGAQLLAEDICVQAAQFSRGSAQEPSPSPASIPATEPTTLALPREADASALGADMQQHEFQLILDALRATRGSRKDAAERLGISPRTLRYKLAKLREAGYDLDGALFRFD
ncbi:sigma-54-dependent transcriptional regulator [Balneatrix alpica]|uniref:Sigma-54-dependent transcriptional regulator n=1 Tax=Balneatrix alpica TaxID=75684 RepID=A0ABV5ZE98_9GAMM|nr:sigma-54 dependent transcriptional regulator [Balneatrix alpica]